MKKLAIAMLLLLPAVALFGQAFEDKVVAKINDNVEVMLSELQAEISSLPQERLEIAASKEGVDQILDQIIRRKLLAEQAKIMQMDTVSVVKNAIRNATEGILADFLIIVIRQNTQPITEEQASEFYASNESLFYSSPAMQLKQIVVATQQEAAEVEKKLKTEDFDKLIDQYPGIQGGPNSGNLGTIPVTQLSEDVYTRISTLSPGQWAGPIQTGSGFHFIKVMKINPAQKLDYKDISEDLQQQLTVSVANNEVNEYIKNLVNNATITRNNSAINEAILVPRQNMGLGN